MDLRPSLVWRWDPHRQNSCPAAPPFHWPRTQPDHCRAWARLTRFISRRWVRLKPLQRASRW